LLHILDYRETNQHVTNIH